MISLYKFTSYTSNSPINHLNNIGKPYWQLDFDKNEENKKKVVVKVVDFPDSDI